MQLNAVRYFIALSDTLNFTKAAEQCNVSQPAFTRAIQKLEEEMGGLLVSRERDNTHLTALGQLVEPQLREMIAQAGQAKKLARRFIRLDQADLRVGVMCTIGPVHFVGFLGRFRGRHPGVELTLLEAVPDRLCDMLMDGSLDVAIMARPDGFGPAFHAMELYRERFVVACSAGHRFAGQRNVPIKHLDGEYYFLRINCEFRDTLRDLLEPGSSPDPFVSKRARGLDSDDGGRRIGRVVLARKLRRIPRRDRLSRRASGGPPRRLRRHRRRPPALCASCFVHRRCPAAHLANRGPRDGQRGLRAGLISSRTHKPIAIAFAVRHRFDGRHAQDVH
jgi:DNA-binding transcriptional LysR family regulator